MRVQSMDQLPSAVRQSQDCCPICLEDLNSSKSAGKSVSSALPCRHLFHTGCIDRWAAEHITCPVGRRIIFSVKLQMRLPADWQTLMLNGARRGEHDQVLALLNRGAPVDANCAQFQTPFALAARNRHFSTAQLLAVQGSTDPVGQYFLGRMYLAGEGVEQNKDRAFLWFFEAAKQGYATAQCMIGYFYRYGLGRPRNTTLAIDWLKKGAAQEHPTSQAALAEIYLENNKFTKDESQGLELLMKAVKNGSAVAMNKLGLMLWRGEYVKVDLIKARHYLQQAARQNFMPAQLSLARTYLEQEDEEKLLKGIELLQALASKGCKEAMGVMGIVYKNRLQDPDRAFEMFYQAVRLGGHGSHFQLGLMYEAGEGTPKDTAKAIHHFQQAAERESACAQFRLGVIYSLGRDTPKDLDKARHWLGKAAEKGYKNARQMLSDIQRPVSQPEPNGVA